MRSILLSLLLILGGCSGPDRHIQTIIPYPVAGPEVAKELRQYCYQCDQTFRWIGEINKMREKVELHNKSILN